jgi:hypothetical protein
MLLKLGVDISKLEKPIRKILPIVEKLWLNSENKEAVITSTYEGTHSPGSLHYANLAIDLRLSSNPSKMLELLKRSIDSNYDIILETDHFHIEYDPK